MDTTDSIFDIADRFRGRFITSPETLREKLFRVKAYLFDWDGVFNNGFKDAHGSSSFSEVDAMGTNMLRLNHFLRTGSLPVTAIITGEQNNAAFTLGRREHFNAVYYAIRHKTNALDHVCHQHRIAPEEVAFVFDDILDFSVAARCGVRIMVQRTCNPLLLDFAIEEQLVDYITEGDGDHHAVRETVEMLGGLSGQYKETIRHRMQFSDTYQHYLSMRNQGDVCFYSRDESEHIIQKDPS